MLCILTVLLTASTAPGRTAFVGENSHPGFAVHDSGRWRVVADVSPDRHQGFGEGRLRQAAECFVAPGGTAGVIDDSANFAQKSIRKSELFSPEGKFAGKTVNDVAELLRKGDLTPADIPLEYFALRSGQTLILNTRSAEALRRAGIPRSQWHGIDISGDAQALRRLAEQLNRNKLWPH
jgi:hypothetical protein